MHVQSFQDAEELIKAVPGLTDGYYHKVTCLHVTTFYSMFNEQHRALLCYLSVTSAMQGFALYHLDDYAGEPDTMSDECSVSFVFSLDVCCFLFIHDECGNACSALLVEQQSI